MTLVAGTEGEFPGNCSVSYLSFVYGRSLWAELNGGENSLHWKANMLALFSIMTLWFDVIWSKSRDAVEWTGKVYYYFLLLFLAMVCYMKQTKP